MSRSLNLVSGLYLKISILTIVAGLVLRIVLLFNGQTSDLGFSPGEWCQVFLLGAMNDLCAATIGFGFLWLFMMSVSETKYRKPWSYIILGILAAAFCYVTFCNTIFDEYGSVAPQVASGILGFWAGTFALRLFFRGFRSYWTTVWFALIITLYVGAIVFNAISEYFFWNEFGVRYNFIAVDYLVYTNEVVGNIMESYPVLPMSLGIIVVTLLITWYLFRRDLGQADRLIGWRWKAVAGPAYIAAMLLAVWLLHFNTRFQDSDNVYVNELQANGLYKFYDAFVKNELDYEQFYITEPEAKAEEFVHGVYGSTGDNLHAVRSEGPEIRRNIVLITIESMSASFMGHFGNTRQLTPVLDSLYDRSLAFDRVYATGNRTVRGLEAVTLSLPPCPGQSIIKRPNNAGMHSTGALLRDKGYTVKYFYGGNSYFDNMETFFSGNGYEIVDQRQYEPGEITFANIWGVCDEDAYRKVIRTLNEDAGRRQAVLRTCHDGEQPPPVHLPGREGQHTARRQVAQRRRDVYRLCTGAVLRRSVETTLVRQYDFPHHGRPLRIERGPHGNPARKIPYPGTDLRPGLRRAAACRGHRFADRPDAYPAFAAQHELRLAFLRPQHLRRGLCQPRVHRNLPGSGLPRRRRVHDPFARAPLRTVPGRSHGGQSPQPRTDGNGKPRTGLARHRLLPDFERVEQTLSAGI